LKRNPYSSEKRRKELDRKKKKEEKKQRKIERLNQVIDPLTGLPVPDPAPEQADGEAAVQPADGTGNTPGV
jgi:hypothetical protein